jgi:hypothetical protein
MKLRALGTHANELSEDLGIFEKCLGELTVEEVGDLRAKSCHKKAISAVCPECHLGNVSQRMGAFRKQFRKHE